MLQVNLLLPLAGKSPTSFNELDLMRLPLGILSGIASSAPLSKKRMAPSA
jgi:hypothetical protein